MDARIVRKVKSVAPEQAWLEGLSPAVPVKQPVATSVPAPHARLQPAKELWMCASLPRLSIEALTLETSQPIAVVEREARTQYVVAADEQARRAGVRAGMPLAAALALMPELHTIPRDVHREQALLERLAKRAQQFTSRVSISQPDALLLEVRGSLRLFGGAKKLYRAFLADCVAAGVRPFLGLAPTPLAALAGARTGKPFIVMNSAQLVGQLASMPLGALRWPLETLDRLSKVGVYSVGQALRLPRAGFARRFGREPLAALDRLTGRSADLRVEFHARERFRARREPSYELEHHEAILHALEPLLRDLERFLRTRQCGITVLECRLRHRYAPATRCVLKLAAPESDAKRLTALLSERLATLTLPEAVCLCEMRSGALMPRLLPADSLWRPGEHGGGVGAEAPAFIERLRARLGVEAVHGLSLFADHRPELAWRTTEPALSGALAGLSEKPPVMPPWPAFRRPLWLLPEPHLLTQRKGLPYYQGPLRLLGEPERIETGWWNGQDVARDYYFAVDARGVRMWIFREREGRHRWFWHGVAG